MEYEEWYRLSELLEIADDIHFNSAFKKIRKVAVDQIGNQHEFEDIIFNPKDYNNSKKTLEQRTNRHQILIKKLAIMLYANGYTLYEYPMDCLAVQYNRPSILFEVKTLDGTHSDEMHQVRLALSQILFYEEFNITQIPKKDEFQKILFFEKKIKKEYISFLEKYDCCVIWVEDDILSASEKSLNFFNKNKINFQLIYDYSL